MKDRVKYKLLCIVTLMMLVMTFFLLAELLMREKETQRTVMAECFCTSEIDIIEEIAIVSDELPAETEKTETSDYFVLEEVESIRVLITDKKTGSIYHDDVNKWDEKHGYRGNIEIMETQKGYVVVNELPLEEYLYSVVPSEMPAGYPMEALKAQAICARTYAYLHVLTPAYPEWSAHVDDTTAFQVYHSVEEQESTNRAVDETRGIVLLTPDGLSLAETYYYSTSCGYGSDARVWRSKYSDNYPYLKSKRIASGIQEGVIVETMAGEGGSSESIYPNTERMKDELVFEEYIKAVHETDFEASEGWYRWFYEVDNVDTSLMLENLVKRYEANPELILTLVGNQYISRPIEELDILVDLKIDKRGNGGVADELIIITEKNVYKVITELNIRYILNNGGGNVKRQDGTSVSMPTLLPSAFIILENKYKSGELVGYEIIGGGFGHGAGMSQNAAKAMALEGMSAEEILIFFFEDCIPGKAEAGVLYE